MHPDSAPDSTPELKFSRNIWRGSRCSPGNLPNYIFSGLAAIGCSDAEIATLTHCDKDQLKEKANFIAEGKARLKHALRKAQLKAALKGNPAMLIWLGKAILGQSDQPSAAPQHTNIVVTADLLSNLQRSYHSTLSDIRRSKAHNDILITPDKSEHSEFLNPVNQPNYPDNLPAIARLGERGTDPESQASDIASSEPIDVAQNVDYTQYDEALNVDTQHVVSQEHGTITPLKDPAPPGVPHPQETPTPTSKRPRSLVLEKTTSYGVAKLAKRWSARLKRMEAARGGSRKEAQLDKGSS